jgi:hypothetical protein
VLDFFGRPWVDEFCTEPLVDRDRLDATEIARLRARLREFYSGLFARQDALVEDGTSVCVRFVEPDVLRIRHLRRKQGAAVSPERSGTGNRDRRPPRALTDTRPAPCPSINASRHQRMRRRTPYRVLMKATGSFRSLKGAR